MTTELETALADFATARTGTLALHIDELGRAALASFTPPEPRKNIEFHRAWLELADDPNARTWCLDSLLERLPKLIDGNEHRSGDKCDALVERLVVLRDAAPDPRIGRAMLTLLELRAPVANFTTVHEEIARVIVRHADDETALSSALDEVRELDRNALPKPAAARAAKPKRDLEALYAAVYAAPDDDAPRAVLADALTDAGDPRGELIALQLREAAGDATPEMTERARELVQTHAKSWLGSLRPIVYRAELRRGFLHTLELEGSYATRKWDELARDPALATVEELETGQATGKVVT
ncbi:MAG TPA: TIGR02996 domain-containing protein, partial [Kofleriaceae bacterium]